MSERKLVLVTAGSKGIGKGIVTKLIQDYDVIFTYRSNPEAAKALASELSVNGSICKCLPCDVIKIEDVQNVCETILAEHGAPYGIVHNAGVAINTLQMMMSIEDWKSMIDTNLNAIFYFHHYLLDPMIVKGEGSIISISSILAFRGNIGQTGYAASKSAHTGLISSLAKEVAMFNIRANSIAPGLIDTEMLSDIPKKRFDELHKGIPLKRLGTPDDVAKVVKFFLSDESQYITGQSLIVDGGLSI